MKKYRKFECNGRLCNPTFSDIDSIESVADLERYYCTAELKDGQWILPNGWKYKHGTGVLCPRCVGHLLKSEHSEEPKNLTLKKMREAIKEGKMHQLPTVLVDGEECYLIGSSLKNIVPRRLYSNRKLIFDNINYGVISIDSYKERID